MSSEAQQLLIASVLSTSASTSTSLSASSPESNGLKAREQATRTAIQQVLATYGRVCAELNAEIEERRNTGEERRGRGNGNGNGDETGNGNGNGKGDEHFKASIRATQALLNIERDRAMGEIRHCVLGEAGLSARKRKRGEYWQARAVVEAGLGELLAAGLG